MQYTLDSVTHAKEVVLSRFSSNKVEEKVYQTKDLNTLTKHENTFYFGVLTCGSNIKKCTVFDDDNEIIDVNKNSQVIELFSHLKFFDETNQEITTGVKGRFRGFEITVL